jgi:hypothetical protein
VRGRMVATKRQYNYSQVNKKNVIHLYVQVYSTTKLREIFPQFIVKNTFEEKWRKRLSRSITQLKLHLTQKNKPKKPLFC